MRLVLCADQAANYSEMSLLLRALSARGHECNFIFPVNSAREVANAGELAELADLAQTGVLSKLTILDLGAVSARSRFQEPKSSEPPQHPLDAMGQPSVPRVVPPVRKTMLARVRPYIPYRRPNGPPTGVRAKLMAIFFTPLYGVLFAVGYAKVVRRKAYRLAWLFQAKVLDSATVRLGRAVKGLHWLGRRRETFMLRYYQELLGELRAEFAAWKPDVLVLPEEVVGPFWSSLVKAARDANLPVLIVPYTIANQQEAFESLKKREEYQAEGNWYAANRFPKWRMRSGGFDIVRLPTAHILAHERLGMTPSDPWMMNSAAVDMICVESEAIRTYFAHAGISPSRLTVTGSAALDEIYQNRLRREAMIKALSAETQISGEKPIILIGGCPNQLRGVVPYCEHQSIDEIVDFVAGALGPIRDRCDVLVRPHPTFRELGDLFAAKGIASTMIPTAHLVPLCSTYIAFASATIRWAIACGIPTVNYDVFGYNYSEFKGIDGVFNVATKSDFLRAVDGLAPGLPKHDEALAALTTAGSLWSMLDGKSVERIEDIARGLVAARRSEGPAS